MNPSDRVNILLVDDQPGKLLTYEAILSQLGENLITASSGREALEHLLKTDITVVLMDVSMPELDGFELAEIIRQHPRYQKTAIIFVSAVHLSDLDRLKGYASGAVDYVSVPIVPELLRAKVSVFTELYRKTRESERLTQELEQRVADRTAELEASMAKQVELAERLQEADHRKDEFLALLAHELRNPLAPIQNAVNIMRRPEAGDADQAWCREVIERQVAQLTRLVDDLLDVSRITQGKIKLRLEPLDLVTIAHRAIETSQPLIDSQRHRLNVTVTPLPIQVLGDPARLTQVVANLLNNAANYQEEEGQIDLEVGREGEFAVIRVKDSGIGIAPEILPKIFELFLQGDLRPWVASRGGLGIGLSLVKTLVEMHGGNVFVVSEGEGRGSEFVIRLPALSNQEAPIGIAPEIPGESRSRPRRVLVVDDNRDAAESLAILLRRHGHEVKVALDGQTALAMAPTIDPEIVLLDLLLPEIDGYEVCRRMRLHGLAEARIIAMTGFGQDRDRLRSQEAGFDFHLVKPFAMDDLLKLFSDL